MSSSSLSFEQSTIRSAPGSSSVRATAETVRGSSPERMRMETPSFENQVSVSFTAGRRVSRRQNRPRQRVTVGRASSVMAPRASASASTRKPRSEAASASGGTWPSTKDGAPRIRTVPSAKAAADFLRAEEKGRVAVGASVPAGMAAASALRVPEPASKAPRKREAAAFSVSSSASMGMQVSSVISPVVSVPVLSEQSTSARARVSMPKSSCTRVCLRPSLTTPASRATEVSRIRPSGIIPIIAPTASGTA